ERAFVNPLHDNHESGIYYCAGCDLPLFSSEHKCSAPRCATSFRASPS
ncbi:MAG: peptide-methionine (R)-S-oxide reductase, partial [Desulfobacterales bacterium]|nr:peptide-methionine (R)-S-oxide reductase [Desulfobacterales bacterium]